MSVYQPRALNSPPMINWAPQHKSVGQQKSIHAKASEYHNPFLQDSLKLLDEKFTYERDVRGDGNCFVRAVAFSYITNRNITKSQEIFSRIDQINLQCLDLSSIPNHFKGIYKQLGIKKMIRQYWNKKIQQYRYLNSPNLLAKLLNTHVILDFILIVYFRALCVHEFQTNKQQYQSFCQGNELVVMKTYGKQSQGLMIRIMADALKVNIFINQVDKVNGLVQIHYQVPDSKFSAYLLFKPGHYDLLQGPKQSKVNSRGSEIKDMKNRTSTIFINPNNKQSNQGNSFQYPAGNNKTNESNKNANTMNKTNETMRMNEDITNRTMQQKQQKNKQDKSGCSKCLQLQEYSPCFQCQLKTRKLNSSLLFQLFQTAENTLTKNKNSMSTPRILKNVQQKKMEQQVQQPQQIFFKRQAVIGNRFIISGQKPNIQ